MTTALSAESANTLDPVATRDQELLELIARQAKRMPLPVFLADIVIAALALPHAHVALVAGWLLAVAATLVVRRIVLTPLPRRDDLEPGRRLRIAAALSLTNGLVHALSLVFLPQLSGLERAVHTIILVALCVGSVATTAGRRMIINGFVMPVLIPLAVLWAVLPVDSDVAWLGPIMASLIVLLTLLISGMAADAYRLFSDSIEIRLREIKLNRDLKLALDKAEAANRAKVRFLASASHDLRQPMHTLAVLAAALGMRPLDERSQRIAGSMANAIDELSRELDALLDISKLDAGLVRVDIAPVDVGTVLNHVRDMFAPAAAAKGLQLATTCRSGLVVATDKTLLERVVRNLTQNAIKYTTRGFVHITGVQVGDRIRISVSDTGMGIPEAEQDRVFEEFYQIGNPERDRTRGLGLGLAIVRRLLDLLAIPFTMTSHVGVGTRFDLDLRPAVAIPAGETSQEIPPISDLRILVVDDEAGIREAMNVILLAHHAQVDLAAGTEEAIAIARMHRPDVVVADFRLRNNDSGIESVRALRMLYPGTPGLLVSGDTAPERLQEADAAGLQLLHKPVKPAVLIRAIAEAAAYRISPPDKKTI